MITTSRNAFSSHIVIPAKRSVAEREPGPRREGHRGCARHSWVPDSNARAPIASQLGSRNFRDDRFVGVQR
jgi:hypothetical protein